MPQLSINTLLNLASTIKKKISDSYSQISQKIFTPAEQVKLKNFCSWQKSIEKSIFIDHGFQGADEKKIKKIQDEILDLYPETNCEKGILNAVNEIIFTMTSLIEGEANQSGELSVLRQDSARVESCIKIAATNYGSIPEADLEYLGDLVIKYPFE